jgi:hypothetical protein
MRVSKGNLFMPLVSELLCLASSKIVVGCPACYLVSASICLLTKISKQELR